MKRLIFSVEIFFCKVQDTLNTFHATDLFQKITGFLMFSSAVEINQ